MVVAGYSVHDDKPWVRPGTQRLGRCKWQIRLFAQNELERHEQEINHKQPCSLYELLHVAGKAADEMLQELDMTVTDAGFQVIKLR